MRTASRLMYLMGTSFLVIGIGYLVWSLLEGMLEIVGLFTLGLSAVLCLLMAFYFGRLVKAAGTRTWPQDDLEADIDDGDPELGFFSPWSWWPVLLAGAASVLVLGLAVGPWVAVIALPVLLVTVVGWVFEYYRGYFVR